MGYGKQNAGTAQTRWMTQMGVLVFIVVLVGMSILTYVGKMSSESLVFLVGTIIGYLFSYMSGKHK